MHLAHVLNIGHKGHWIWSKLTVLVHCEDKAISLLQIHFAVLRQALLDCGTRALDMPPIKYGMTIVNYLHSCEDARCQDGCRVASKLSMIEEVFHRIDCWIECIRLEIAPGPGRIRAPGEGLRLMSQLVHNELQPKLPSSDYSHALGVFLPVPLSRVRPRRVNPSAAMPPHPRLAATGLASEVETAPMPELDSSK